MDYAYYQAAPQPYQFMGLPPTPAHTNSASSEEYRNTSPPQQDPFDQFQSFDAFNDFNAGMPGANPLTPQSQHKPSLPIEDPERQRQGSNSDDEDMTPAQSRRKAQNRAAQRAFRERKERHVKELEAKLSALEQDSVATAAENARLKAELQKASTENEILKATSGRASPPPLQNAGPMTYSPTDFYTKVLYAHENKVPSHRIVEGPEGRMLAAGAAWDLIIAHPLYKEGRVDVVAVSEGLKQFAKCDGQGPVFEEGHILRAIEASAVQDNDELL